MVRGVLMGFPVVVPDASRPGFCWKIFEDWTSYSRECGDRPDVTNSPIVVPAGSLQSENGIDTSRDHGADILNGTNSRWRLGIAPCLEVLVDLPNYFATLRGVGPSGFGDVAPAVKWQISPLPGKFDLSLTVGAALPTGATDVAGPGVQPYVQFPWSIDLGGDWALNGMETG